MKRKERKERKTNMNTEHPIRPPNEKEFLAGFIQIAPPPMNLRDIKSLQVTIQPLVNSYQVLRMQVAITANGQELQSQVTIAIDDFHSTFDSMMDYCKKEILQRVSSHNG